MKQILLFLASLAAPVVCLFYRKGIWLTPDDPVSPFGCGTTPGASVEPFMQKLYAKAGKFVGDWWWLGWRNSAYGLAYKWKPDVFKTDSYDHILFSEVNTGKVRKITAEVGEESYTETTYFGPFFHVIWGYRIRPMRNTARDGIPVRPINMDGRPIFSIRFGKNDD